MSPSATSSGRPFSRIGTSPLFRRADAFRVDVGADDVVPEMREARSGGQTDVPGADDGDVHAGIVGGDLLRTCGWIAGKFAARLRRQPAGDSGGAVPSPPPGFGAGPVVGGVVVVVDGRRRGHGGTGPRPARSRGRGRRRRSRPRAYRRGTRRPSTSLPAPPRYARAKLRFVLGSLGCSGPRSCRSRCDRRSPGGSTTVEAGAPRARRARRAAWPPTPEPFSTARSTSLAGTPSGSGRGRRRSPKDRSRSKIGAASASIEHQRVLAVDELAVRSAP